MKASRGIRILGMMLFFGVMMGTLAGTWKHAEPATLAAILVGAFIGEAWHRARESGLI